MDMKTFEALASEAYTIKTKLKELKEQTEASDKKPYMLIEGIEKSFDEYSSISSMALLKMEITYEVIALDWRARLASTPENCTGVAKMIKQREEQLAYVLSKEQAI